MVISSSLHYLIWLVIKCLPALVKECSALSSSRVKLLTIFCKLSGFGFQDNISFWENYMSKDRILHALYSRIILAISDSTAGPFFISLSSCVTYVCITYPCHYSTHSRADVKVTFYQTIHFTACC